LGQTKEDYMAAETRNADNITGLSARLVELGDSVERLHSQKKDLLNENRGLLQKLCNTKGELNAEKSTNLELRHEVEAKTHKLAIAQTNVDLLHTVQEQRDSLLKDLARSREDSEALQMQVDQREREFMGKLGDTNSIERKLKEELHKASSANQNSELTIQKLKGEITSNARDILELKNHSVTLEQLLSVKEDVYSQLQAANKLADARDTEASLSRGQMAAAGKVIEAQEEKIFETGKCLIY
jgi:low affinity Fe/Cu permease